MKNTRTHDLIYDILPTNQDEKMTGEALWQKAGKPFKQGFLDTLKEMALDEWIMHKKIKKTVFYWKVSRIHLKENFELQRVRAWGIWYVDMMIEHFWYDKLAEDHRDLFGKYGPYHAKFNWEALGVERKTGPQIHPSVNLMIMPIFFQFYDLNLALQNRIRVALDTKQAKPYEVEPILKDCQKDVKKVFDEILKGHEHERKQFLEYVADHYRTKDLFV